MFLILIICLRNRKKVSEINFVFHHRWRALWFKRFIKVHSFIGTLTAKYLLPLVKLWKSGDAFWILLIQDIVSESNAEKFQNLNETYWPILSEHSSLDEKDLFDDFVALILWFELSLHLLLYLVKRAKVAEDLWLYSKGGTLFCTFKPYGESVNMTAKTWWKRAMESSWLSDWALTHLNTWLSIMHISILFLWIIQPFTNHLRRHGWCHMSPFIHGFIDDIILKVLCISWWWKSLWVIISLWEL